MNTIHYSVCVIGILSVFLPTAGAAERNEWYWNSPVNIHWDNHGNPLGKGTSVDEIVKRFTGIKVDMIQVSGRSGYTTYPSRLGVSNPGVEGYDTLATWREVTRRLGTRFWVYINVIGGVLVQRLYNPVGWKRAACLTPIMATKTRWTRTLIDEELHPALASPYWSRGGKLSCHTDPSLACRAAASEEAAGWVPPFQPQSIIRERQHPLLF